MVKLTAETSASKSKTQPKQRSAIECDECGTQIEKRKGWFSMKHRVWRCDDCEGYSWIGDIEDDL